jgi:hypothetical protein
MRTRAQVDELVPAFGRLVAQGEDAFFAGVLALHGGQGVVSISVQPELASPTGYAHPANMSVLPP